MKKIIAFSFSFLVLLTIGLTGCSGASEPDVSLSEILVELETAVSIDGASQMTETDLLDFYGIQASDIAEQASLISMSGIFPDEVIMIKAQDEEALGRIREKLDNRLQEVLNQSKSYDAESYAIAQKCAVDVRGLYAALFISPTHETMTQLYAAHFE